jgi:hypothetical protein
MPIQGGEHSVEKIFENSIRRLKKIWKHTHSEEKTAYFSLKWKQKSLKSAACGKNVTKYTKHKKFGTTDKLQM